LATQPVKVKFSMPKIQRSALVEHSAARMFALVNDIASYPRRFDWCYGAKILESDEHRIVARLDLGLGALRTWFTTENTLSPPHHIDMQLRDGPFRKLSGRWEFHALDESACKVMLTLDFEPRSRLLGPAMALGFQALADRMVDDFVRVANGLRAAAPVKTA
jgi:ribosome-associated toxin RatA of RatAB toxin-antitoxin module